MKSGESTETNNDLREKLTVTRQDDKFTITPEKGDEYTVTLDTQFQSFLPTITIASVEKWPSV
jgi:hypothetical protein